MDKILTIEERKEAANEIFAANPTIKKLHTTVDGMCFEHAGIANNHASSLANDGENKQFERDLLLEISEFDAEPVAEEKTEVPGEDGKTSKTKKK